MAAAWLTSWPAFSSMVIRETRSSTRWSNGREGFRYAGCVPAPVCWPRTGPAPNARIRAAANDASSPASILSLRMWNSEFTLSPRRPQNGDCYQFPPLELVAVPALPAALPTLLRREFVDVHAERSYLHRAGQRFQHLFFHLHSGFLPHHNARVDARRRHAPQPSLAREFHAVDGEPQLLLGFRRIHHGHREAS